MSSKIFFTKLEYNLFVRLIRSDKLLEIQNSIGIV